MRVPISARGGPRGGRRAVVEGTEVTARIVVAALAVVLAGIVPAPLDSAVPHTDGAAGFFSSIDLRWPKTGDSLGDQGTRLNQRVERIPAAARRTRAAPANAAVTSRRSSTKPMLEPRLS
jgi:hypothetical protein